MIRVGLFAAALALAYFAARVIYPSDPASHVGVTVAIALAFVATGLIAWARLPASRIGHLITVLGFALLVRKFAFGDPSSWAFTVGYAVRDLPWVVFGHIVLAYPSGRLGSRTDRVAAVAAYAAALAFPIASLLVHEPDPAGGAPGRSAIAFFSGSGLYDPIRAAEHVVVYIALAVIFLFLVARKIRRTSPRGRRMFLPLLAVALLLAVRGMTEAVFNFVSYSARTEEILFWTGQAVELALPVALLVGVFRTRFAQATLAEAMAELEDVSATEVRDALARALSDPSLTVAFWVPERATYVDAAGARVELPDEGSDRAVTRIDHDGERVAALVHDPALADEPGLVKAAAGAAALALENARLHAELRAQLARVQESRARIVAAADDERRRIERDLHDGAQQRLVALALQLRAAQRRLGSVDGVDQVLSSAVDELQQAVTELRELAHGVHPSVLTQNGLGAALEALADKAPVPVTVATVPEGRLPEAVEGTAYFVVCEALANAVKHSGASGVTISAGRRDGLLLVEVIDDGVGGADPSGSGLSGLADRVEARGGRLRVDSRPSVGTRIVAEIPCAS